MGFKNPGAGCFVSAHPVSQDGFDYKKEERKTIVGYDYERGIRGFSYDNWIGLASSSKWPKD